MRQDTYALYPYGDAPPRDGDKVKWLGRPAFIWGCPNGIVIEFMFLCAEGSAQ